MARLTINGTAHNIDDREAEAILEGLKARHNAKGRAEALAKRWGTAMAETEVGYEVGCPFVNTGFWDQFRIGFAGQAFFVDSDGDLESLERVKELIDDAWTVMA